MNAYLRNSSSGWSLSKYGRISLHMHIHQFSFYVDQLKREILSVLLGYMMEELGQLRLALILFELCSYKISDGGLAPTWDSCECSWGSWAAWSDCTRTCGGGSRYRDRIVWVRDVPECAGFEYCATADMAYDFNACNTVCQNGGSFVYITGMIRYPNYGQCVCTSGKYGTCCEQST